MMCVADMEGHRCSTSPLLTLKLRTSEIAGGSKVYPTPTLSKFWAQSLNLDVVTDTSAYIGTRISRDRAHK